MKYDAHNHAIPKFCVACMTEKLSVVMLKHLYNFCPANQCEKVFVEISCGLAFCTTYILISLNISMYVSGICVQNVLACVKCVI